MQVQQNPEFLGSQQVTERTQSLFRPVNSMSDPRVAKGSTWAREAGGSNYGRSLGLTNTRTRALQNAARTGVSDLMSMVPERPSLPSIPVQTAPYLEAYPDKIEEAGACTQTDPMLEIKEPAPTFRRPRVSMCLHR